MGRIRPRINLRAEDKQARDLGYDIGGDDDFDEIEAVTDDYGDNDSDNDLSEAYVDENYDEYETDETPPPGLLSTPGRVITLAASVLMLVLVTGIVAWLLGAKAGKTASYVGASSNTGVSNLQTAVKVGALAPDFALNEIYTGKLTSLASLQGKPVWVNFWASWCGPCKAEMPEMKQRYAKYKDKGLVILGVDDKEDNATVKQFTELNDYKWTFVIDGDGSVLQKYVISGIPTHMFLDKSGVIRYMIVGGISGDMMDDGLNKIMSE